ncbi:hypothetical protein E2C01_048036 [Portunus trituberculatus]|uniref:Uncharacterized protein n=1 Tax=Portunus trituberculatus TaxID=210409 RepID=A0A5B7G939_PORTR|nr:hypothetical protein [Portunus trituberculatus]
MLTKDDESIAGFSEENIVRNISLRPALPAVSFLGDMHSAVRRPPPGGIANTFRPAAPLPLLSRLVI